MDRKAIVRKLTELGWYVARHGKHEIWKHPDAKSFIPVPKNISHSLSRFILACAEKYVKGELPKTQQR